MKTKRYEIRKDGFTYSYRTKEAAKKDFPDDEPIVMEVYEAHLIELDLLNEKGQAFQKGFDDVRSCQLFLNKIKHGEKLTVTGVYSYNQEVLNELKF